MTLRSTTVALCVLATVGACAPAAGAASIFFLRDSNIWVANPDGSDAQQVTTDGTSSAAYLHVSSAKQGTAPAVGYLRYDGSSFVYGTMHPDGTGMTPDPYSPMPGFTQGDDHDMSLSLAGDKIAWSRATDIGHGETFSPRVVGTDGSGFGGVSRATSAINTTFGDPSGNSLLFDDQVGDDYRDANNSAEGWPNAPSPCTAGVSAHGLVQQVPVDPQTGTLAAPLAYYCPAGAVDLFAPALSPDGSTIAVQAAPTASQPLDASLASGKPRIAVFPASAAASGSTATPLTYLSPDGLEAGAPDFSPDGSQIAFSAPDGVYVVGAGGGTPTRVLDNATAPAWSSYTLAAAGGGSSSSGDGSSGAGAGGGAAASPVVALPRGQRLRRVLAHGARVRLTAVQAGATIVSLAVTRADARRLHIGRKATIVGQAKINASPGKRTVTVRIARRYRRALSRVRRITLAVIVQWPDGSIAIKSLSLRR